MTNETVIAVTEDQAAKLEAAGFPVKVEYTAKLEDLIQWIETAKVHDRTKVAPKLTIRRRIKVPCTTILRWTGVKYSGRKDTQEYIAYHLLAAYFSKPRSALQGTATRKEINALLAEGFTARGQVFSSSIVSGLLRQKYLEVSR